ncbi:hypothetical protein SKAU_G00043860 [Synaphobranchus kaupii]|uniref:Uncharacterized protein n=1 Tax=Synaphobranchus kaupii TaxID=118154 RepID=A0A9Q1G2H0_SYNKA|nr:hypothetical protein SKAU_G00043860 [Synaphobranchus kaupii]
MTGPELPLKVRTPCFFVKLDGRSARGAEVGSATVPVHCGKGAATESVGGYRSPSFGGTTIAIFARVLERVEKRFRWTEGSALFPHVSRVGWGVPHGPGCLHIVLPREGKFIARSSQVAAADLQADGRVRSSSQLGGDGTGLLHGYS